MIDGCMGCDRTGVALLGSFCGHCDTSISRAVNDSIESLDIVDGRVHDVFVHRDDGRLTVRIDLEEGRDD